ALIHDVQAAGDLKIETLPAWLALVAGEKADAAAPAQLFGGIIGQRLHHHRVVWVQLLRRWLAGKREVSQIGSAMNYRTVGQADLDEIAGEALCVQERERRVIGK